MHTNEKKKPKNEWRGIETIHCLQGANPVYVAKKPLYSFLFFFFFFFKLHLLARFFLSLKRLFDLWVWGGYHDTTSGKHDCQHSPWHCPSGQVSQLISIWLRKNKSFSSPLHFTHHLRYATRNGRSFETCTQRFGIKEKNPPSFSFFWPKPLFFHLRRIMSLQTIHWRYWFDPPVNLGQSDW